MHDVPHHTMSRYVKRDTKCHALKTMKSPLSNNCCKIGMTMSNIAEEKATRGFTSQCEEVG